MCGFLLFLKKPKDYKLDISLAKKWKLFAAFLLLEVLIIFLVLFPIYYLIDFITPLHQEAYLENFTLLKSIIFLVFLVPFIEEVIFRLVMRYSGIVKAIMSRETWNRIFPYLVYALSIIFGLVHVSNYANDDVLFYVFAPLLVISQLTGGFVISYLRVRLNFWWGCLFHFTWNFIFVVLFTLVEGLFSKPYIQNTDTYSISIEEKPFYDSDRSQTIKIENKSGKISRLVTEQSQLQAVLDTLYGKNNYYAESYYLDIEFEAKEGVEKSKFIDLIKDEYDIISSKTNKKID